MRKSVRGFRSLAPPAVAAALVFFAAAAPAAAYPVLSQDFVSMMGWLGREMVQGLAFNAGETFDPPREIMGLRLQPDVSLGVGHMPFDKGRFPPLQTPALQATAPAMFPSSVLFPVLTLHLRMGLPWRSDCNIRVADTQIPNGYRLSPTTTAQGQSNSIGFGVRKHFLGGDLPLLRLGANYNHVYGNITLKSSFDVTESGITLTSPVDCALGWNVNSYGLNAVMSQTYGRWTPFVGFGYNYLTGSVRASLNATPNPADLVTYPPITGEASQRPEQFQGRALFGVEMSRTWVNLFANGEVKTIGVSSGKSWIVQMGMSLPFTIGAGGVRQAAAQKAQEARQAEARRSILSEEPDRPGPAKRAGALPELIEVR